MPDALAVVSRVLPVILLIALGKCLQKRRFVSPRTIEDLKRIVLLLALPALLFPTFAQTVFERRYALIFPVIFFVCAGMLGVGKLYARLVRRGSPYLPAVFCSSETGLMGYPLFLAVFGPSEVYKLAILDVGQAIFTFIFLAGYVRHIHGRTTNVRHLVSDFLRTPIVLAILAGILCGVTGIGAALTRYQLYTSFLETLDLLSRLTVPLICVAIGYELRIRREGLAQILGILLIRMALLIGLAFLISTFLFDRWLGLDRMFTVALFTLFTLPVPFVTPLFMQDAADADRQFVLNAVSLSIPLSLIAFMIAMAAL
jgi:predicted permease